MSVPTERLVPSLVKTATLFLGKARIVRQLLTIVMVSGLELALVAYWL